MDEEFIDKVNNLKEVIRNTPYDVLQERVYICFANGCLLLTSFLQSKGTKGWSARLIDDSGQPMLDSKEQKTIEETFEKAPWLWDMLSQVGKKSEEQEGGALPQINPSGVLAGRIPGPGFELTGDDVSLDKYFQKFLDFTNKMDDFWADFQTGPGAPVKAFIEGDQLVPIGQVPVPVPRKPVVMLLVALIDSFRISAALAGYKNSLLTLLVLFQELVTGQWRQMIMTAVGLISPMGVAVGVVGKYIINAWMLINPTLRDELLRDMYKGSKSFFIGFLLWAVSNLPPAVVKRPIEGALMKMRGMVEGLDEKIKGLEEQGSRPLAKVGKQLKFSKLNLEPLTKISLADIQNFQALAQWDLILCTKEFQEIIEPLAQEPIFRLIIELLGIPTTPEDKLRICGGEPYKSVGDRVEDAFTPQIVDIPGDQEEQRGGKRRLIKKSYKKRTSRKNKSTRL